MVASETVFQLDVAKETMIANLLALKILIESNAENGIQLALPSAIILPGLIVLVAIGSILLLNASISRPLLKISKNSIDIAAGNISVKMDYDDVDRKDEIGVLISSFNQMLHYLQNTVRQISDVSLSISSASEEVAASSTDINASTEEISSIAQQLSRGSIEQTTKITETLKIAHNLRDNFYEKIQGIEGAAKLIEDLTRQVNMLALNASIEAARAGEYGRGFAVVADNIRTLADGSSNSLNQVKQITSELKNALESNINAITNSIQEIVSISEEAAAGAEEASAATEEQSATMEELSASAQELADISHKLHGLVEGFII